MLGQPGPQKVLTATEKVWRVG